MTRKALVWTASARAGLARLHRFLATKSPDAAGRALAAIRDGVGVLSEFPQTGRRFDDETDLREWFIPFGDAGYVLLYRLDHDRVVVLAIRHAREAGYG